MALTQVRAKLGSTWVTLTYNEATGRYEGTLTPPGTSIHQPEGYYPVTVEATSDSGETATASGENTPGLRLVVRETTSPTLTLISPSPGYLQTETPTFVFEATDEEGGSGVNPETFSLPGATREEISGGYRFTWTPPDGWADGPHTVTASVSDYDGNEATVSGAYLVDTVPPVLIVDKPYQRHVVDDESVLVAGQTWDITAPNVTVSVAGEAVPVVSGKFETTVPLEIGENHIPVTVTDGAGNQTTAEVYMIRLVTDRTQADIVRLTELYQRPVEEWTEQELDWFNTAACLRGSYDAADLNRVGTAVGYLAGELQRRGYIASVQTKTDWTEDDAPVRSQMQTYLANVVTVRDAQPVEIPVELPATMRKSGIEGWNNIEKALVETDAIFPNYFAWTAGEVTCGGY